jgi:hypothetical protein
MAVNATQLKADVEEVVVDGEKVIDIVEELEAIPEVAKIPGAATLLEYAAKAQTVLKDVQEFLSEA